MLTFEQYTEIVAFIMRKYNPSTLFVSITNEYFDNDNLDLLNHGVVLRVRSSLSDGIILTVKIPLEDKKGDIEVSQTLSYGVYQAFKNGVFPDGVVKDSLFERCLLFPNIKYQTYLKCKRTEIKDGEHTIVVDDNFYNDIRDFNLEVEASSYENAHKKILELVDMFNIEFKDCYISKSRRVLLNRFNLL